jgi:hypothetical protein
MATMSSPALAGYARGTKPPRGCRRGCTRQHAYRYGNSPVYVIISGRSHATGGAWDRSEILLSQRFSYVAYD